MYAFQPSLELEKEESGGIVQLEKQGWAYFKIFCAPAAGPRNKCTMGLDIKLRNLSRSGALGTEKRWLVGGSLAALRFSALITGCVSGAPATEELQAAFTAMVYEPSMGPADARKLLKTMMEDLNRIAAPRPADIVHHPSWRLAIMVTAMRPWATLIPEWQLKAIFYSFLAINTATHSVVESLQRRICFYTGPTLPPFGHDTDILFVPLTEHNYYQVLHATTCIPFVSVPCTYISGLGRGLYYDGALSDYHLNLKLKDPSWPALLLSAGSVGDPVLSNIWDTFLPWRSLKVHAFEQVSLLCTTAHFKHQLPRGRLPKTEDFFDREYMANPELRFQAWNKAFELSCTSMPDHPMDALTVSFETACPCLEGPLAYAMVLSAQALQRAWQACRMLAPIPLLPMVSESKVVGTGSSCGHLYRLGQGRGSGSSRSSSSSSSSSSSADVLHFRGANCTREWVKGEERCKSSGGSGGSNSSSCGSMSTEGNQACEGYQDGRGFDRRGRNRDDGGASKYGKQTDGVSCWRGNGEEVGLGIDCSSGSSSSSSHSGETGRLTGGVAGSSSSSSSSNSNNNDNGGGEASMSTKSALASSSLRMQAACQGSAQARCGGRSQSWWEMSMCLWLTLWSGTKQHYKPVQLHC